MMFDVTSVRLAVKCSLAGLVLSEAVDVDKTGTTLISDDATFLVDT